MLVADLGWFGLIGRGWLIRAGGLGGMELDFYRGRGYLMVPFLKSVLYLEKI